MLNPLSPTDCSRAREAASARLDGELNELEGAHLDAHLLGCDDCRSYLAEIGSVARALRAAALEEPRLSVFAERRRRPVIRVHVAAAAVVLVAMTGGSFALGQMIGAHGSDRTATVGSTVALVKTPNVALPKRGPAHLVAAQVIPV
jgi:predicted anti-sigma-YlaC factor YlaD